MAGLEVGRDAGRQALQRAFVQLGRLGGPLEQARVLALPDLLGPCLQTLHVHSISPPARPSLPRADACGQSDEVAGRGLANVTEWAWRARRLRAGSSRTAGGYRNRAP